MKKLAIAAYSFNTPSETFIQDHVRMIAPRETILLCVDGLGAEQFGCPVLSYIDPWLPPKKIGERVISSVRSRWRRYFQMGPPRAERRRILAFFDAYRPKAFLAEYGPTG